MQEEITIQFTPNRSDHIESSRAYYTRSRTMLFMNSLLLLLFGLVLAYSIPNGEIPIAWVVILIIALVNPIFIVPSISGYIFNKKHYLKSDLKFILDKQGITIKNEHAQLALKWDSFSQLIETSNQFVLSSSLYPPLGHNDMKSKRLIIDHPFVFIPKRAIESTDHQNGLLAILNDYFESPAIKQSRRVFNIAMSIGGILAVALILAVVFISIGD